MSGFTTRPELRGGFGMVASTHWIASGVGMAMLERGGNAFDAAVAAGFALQVVEPHQNGAGGDMPAVFYSARTGKVEVLCAQAPAPAGATIAHYRDEGLSLIPGTGQLAAVIPGAVGGWLTMLRDHGTLSLADVLAPAIGYARDGFPVVPVLSAYIERVAPLFLEHWTSSADTYLSGGTAPAPGSLFRNPALAETYARLVREGEAAGGDREAQLEAAYRAFYSGFVAEAIERFSLNEAVYDSTGERRRGVLTAEDLAAWRPAYEAPVSCDYHGWTVHKTGPWGQGPVMLQTLALLDGMGLDGADPMGPDFLHILVEAMKLAFADREAWYGDPDWVDVPLSDLLSPAYNAARRALIGVEASLELRPGAPGGRPPVLPGAVGADTVIGAGEGEPNAAMAAEVRSDTVHVDVVDRWGNMVSAMPSGGWLQSNPVIPSLGFCLGTRAQMFWLEDGLPASLAPGKRPRSTLSPGLATRDGRPALAFGSPGGDGQDQWALLMLLRHLHCGMNLQAAIDAPSVLSLHAPNSFYPRKAEPGLLQVEGRLPEATIAALARRGHRIERMGDWTLGRLAAVAKDGAVLKAAAHPRFVQAYAAGR